MNPYLKLAASAGLFGSLFYLVLTGKIQASDYQTLAVGSLAAVGGWHARSSGKPDLIPDAGKMVAAPDQFRDATKMINPQANPANPTQPPKEG